jgi:hypothetical protein
VVLQENDWILKFGGDFENIEQINGKFSWSLQKQCQEM